MNPSELPHQNFSKAAHSDQAYLERLDSEIFSLHPSSQDIKDKEASDIHLLIGYLCRLLELQNKPLDFESASIPIILSKNNIYFRCVSVPAFPGRGDYPLMLLSNSSDNQHYLLLQGTPHNRLLTFEMGRKVLITDLNQFPDLKPTAIEIPYTLADRKVTSKSLLEFAYKRNFYTLFFLFAAALIVIICGLSIPLLTNFMVSEILPNGDYWLLIQSLIAMSLVLLLSIFASYLQGVFAIRMLTIGARNIEVAVLERFLKVPKLAIKNFSVGELFVCVDAVTKLRGLLSSDFLTSIFRVIFSVLFLALMFFYSRIMALAVVTFTVPVFVVVYFLDKRTIKLYDKVYDIKSDLEQLSSQISTDTTSIRALGAEFPLFKDWNDGFRRVSYLLKNINFSDQLIKVLFDYYGIAGTVLILGVATARIFSDPNILKDPALVGSFLAFYASFIAFSRSLVAATAYIANSFGIVAILWKRVLRILGVEVEPGWNAKLPQQRLKGNIRFDSVSFHPDDLKCPVLDSIDLEIVSGQKFLVIGPKSSGKSCLLRLINGLLSPTQGAIYLDSLALQSSPIQSVRSQIHFIASNPSLIGLRIVDVLGIDSINSSQELESILSELGVSSAIDNLPEGMNSLITAGLKLSAADKIKLLLARSLLNPPPILLLDEFLASVPLGDHSHLLALVKELPSTVVMVPTTTAELDLSSQKFQICDGRLTPLTQPCFEEFLATNSLSST